MTKFKKQQRDLALRYLNCRGSIVPRLAVPYSVKYKKYRDKILDLNKFLSLVSLTMFFVSKYIWINIIIYVLLIVSILIQIFLYYKSK